MARPEPSSTGGNRGLVSGGHTGRPYGKTGGVSVGAVFMAARNTANMKKLKIRRDFEK